MSEKYCDCGEWSPEWDEDAAAYKCSECGEWIDDSEIIEAVHIEMGWICTCGCGCDHLREDDETACDSCRSGYHASVMEASLLRANGDYRRQ
jgi:hypothetical protein